MSMCTVVYVSIESMVLWRSQFVIAFPKMYHRRSEHFRKCPITYVCMSVVSLPGMKLKTQSSSSALEAFVKLLRFGFLNFTRP